MRDAKRLIHLLWMASMVVCFTGGHVKAQWVGIAQSGDWPEFVYVRDSLKQLLEDNQRDYDQAGLRLTYMVPFFEGGQQRWLGIARGGDWTTRVYVRDSLKRLLDDNQRDFNEIGLRLTHVVPFIEGGQQHWVGIARSGDWATRVYVRDSLKQILADTQRDFDEGGLRVTHLIPFFEGEQQHWLSIARAGDWAVRVYVRESLKQLLDDNQRDFDQAGLRLTHLTPFMEDGRQHWVGIARAGNWQSRVYVRDSLRQLLEDNQRDFNQAGFRLTSVQPPR